MPASSCRRITSRTARSSIALNAGGSSSPAACFARASSSSGGRRRLPTWSAWAVTIGGTLVVQEGGELAGDRVGVVCELAPGEADDAPAGDDELAVLRAVCLECLARAVGREAVALDDEEAALENARGDGMGDLAVVLEDSPQDRCPSASGVSLEEGIERSRAREAADLRFLEGRFEVLIGEDGGKVEQRARGRGDRDALHDRDLVGLQHGLVELHSRAGSAMADHGHLSSPSRVAHAPQRGRRAMAENGSVSARKRRRHPPAVTTHTTVADREHAAMKRIQRAAADAAVYRAPSDAGGEQLRSSDDAVLACRGLPGAARHGSPRKRNSSVERQCHASTSSITASTPRAVRSHAKAAARRRPAARRRSAVAGSSAASTASAMAAGSRGSA